MDKQSMTPEQRYWYLKGYIDCFVPELASSLKISETEARKTLGNILTQVINVKGDLCK